MKIIILFLLLLNSFLAYSEDCYPFKGENLCVPQIDQGNIISTSNQSANFLPPLVRKLFNRSANYSGPNCYNTALVLSGVLKSNDIRYISKEEFEILLKNNFWEVASPVAGDLVVYEANSQRGHVSYYLGDDLVFHKKSFHKNYLYRIVPMEEVGKIEKGEWTPSPWEDFPVWSEINIGKTKKAYYRKNLNPVVDNFKAGDKLWIDILDHIQIQLIKDGPNWAVGKNMGLITENFLNTALNKAQKELSHPFVLAKILSLKDQVFQSLEEMYFSRVHDQNHVDEINEEICFSENEYTNLLINKTALLLKKEVDGSTVSTWTELKNADRRKCKVDIFSNMR